MCEHKTLNLACPHGKVLQIKSAKYGRDRGDMRTCYSSHLKDHFIRIMFHNCHAGSSNGKTMSFCNDDRKCSVLAENRIFGDPCKYVYKYLRVHYDCVSGKCLLVKMTKTIFLVSCIKSTVNILT